MELSGLPVSRVLSGSEVKHTVDYTVCDKLGGVLSGKLFGWV